MGINYSYTGPEFRGAPKMVKEAIDQGFSYHQRENLPKHFEESAPRRYRGAYQKRGNDAKKGTEAWAQRWARMSNAEKAKITRQLQDRRTLMKGAKKKKLPLVVSGILRRAVTKGHLKGVGPAGRRRALIPAPHYLSFHRPGQIHKRSALQAVLPQEARNFVKIVDSAVSVALKRRLTRKRKRS